MPRGTGSRLTTDDDDSLSDRLFSKVEEVVSAKFEEGVQKALDTKPTNFMLHSFLAVGAIAMVMYALSQRNGPSGGTNLSSSLRKNIENFLS